MRPGFPALLLTVGVLLAFALVACVPPDEEAEESESALAWSKDRFALSAIAPGNVHYGDAFWLARLSAIAYREPADVEADLRAIGANGELAFFTNARTDTQGIYIGTPTHAILVFRGTEISSLRDIATDVRRHQKPTLFGHVHVGFLDAFESIWADGDRDLHIAGLARPGEGMRSFLFRRASWDGTRPLVIAGHSLGGALAEIAAVHLSYRGCLTKHPHDETALTEKDDEVLGTYFLCNSGPRPVDAIGNFESRRVSAVYTFGAPRPGDRVFGQLAFALGAIGVDTGQRRVFRVRNTLDVVTRLPYFGYYHPHRGGDEGASMVPVTSLRLPAHFLSSYESAILAKIRPGLVVPDPPDPREAKLLRFQNALANSGRPSIAKARLGGRAAMHFARLEALGLSPTATSFEVDGEPAYSVEVELEAVRRVLAFDKSFEFVVEVGAADGPYATEEEPPL